MPAVAYGRASVADLGNLQSVSFQGLVRQSRTYGSGTLNGISQPLLATTAVIRCTDASIWSHLVRRI